MADCVLAAVGRPAVPALAELLSSPDLAVVTLAASALRQIGPEAAEATPALVAQLRARGSARAPRGSLAARITSALEHIGPAARAATPALLALFEDRGAGHFDRYCAMRAMVAVAGTSRVVLRALIDVLEHPEKQETFGEVVSVLEEVKWLGPPISSFWTKSIIWATRRRPRMAPVSATTPSAIATTLTRL